MFENYFVPDELSDFDENTLYATCSVCGYEEEYKMDEQEVATLMEYQTKGREMGYIQNLFPKVPAWIRSCCIDQYSGGFCICPKCCG